MEPQILTQLKAFGLTQEQIAIAIGVPKGTVSNWHTGRHAISSRCMTDLQELLLILRERLKAGMTTPQALADWAPTSYTIDVNQPVEDHTWIQAYRQAPPRNPEAITTADDIEQVIEQRRQTLLRELARERRKPRTAEALMRQRRLGRELAATVELLQWYELQRQEGEGHAGHEQA
jgi:transcriptional regulator with XRE-family HTH domain